MKVSIIIPTYNESQNIEPLLKKLAYLSSDYQLEIIVVDDDSPDGTAEKVREIASFDKNIRLLRRIGRSGLASAIQEGLLNSSGDISLVMDGDGQHDPSSISSILNTINSSNFDLVIGSRFHPYALNQGLSSQRERGSLLANQCARFTLPSSYSNITDYMSGFFALRTNRLIPIIRQVDVNGFKFLYELLALSKGKLLISEIPLIFNRRLYGFSKLDLAIFWDFFISLLNTLSFRLVPRRAISFALVGSTGVFVQLLITSISMAVFNFSFTQSLPLAVITAATSNYLINNALTFRFQRLYGIKLFKGLLKFLLVSSLPVIANIGLATAFYEYVSDDTLLAQLAGIILVFVWNYAASSAFVWNTPS